MLRVLASFAALSLAACSTLGGGGGGGDNLPNRGIIPYVKVEIPEPPDPDAEPPPEPEGDVDVDEPEGPLGPPLVLVPDEPVKERWIEPSAVVRPDNPGAVELFFQARLIIDKTSLIMRAGSEDGQTFGVPVVVIDPAAGPEWLEGQIEAPSVVFDSEEGSYHMAFSYARRAGIGYATSANGLSWQIADEPLLVPEGVEEEAGIGSPSLVFDGDTLRLYYDAVGGEEDAPSRIYLATAPASDPLQMSRQGLILDVGTGCLDFDGSEEACWDSAGVGAPEVRIATNEAGRTIYRLFYAGTRNRSHDLGFAASFDGLTFERFPFNPVVDEGIDEDHPTNVIFRGAYLLYFFNEESTKLHGIGLAINDASAPAERF